MKNLKDNKTRKRILITAALPYVNNIPHLGNIVGSTLSADVFARFCRSREYETLFICGTDEFGSASEVSAINKGITPQELCSKNYMKHSNIYKTFSLSFNFFGRTSIDENHTQLTQQIFKELVQTEGLITAKQVERLFCPNCKLALADRFVIGNCYECGFQDIKGDQCDSCGILIDSLLLLDAKCSICSTKPLKYKTEHLYLDLDSIRPKLEKHLKTVIGDKREKEEEEEEADKVKEKRKRRKWSKVAIDVTRNWLKKRFEKRCITRDLKWGIKVPNYNVEKGKEVVRLCNEEIDKLDLKQKEREKEKVFFVWFDAPVGYISFTKSFLSKSNSLFDLWWKSSNSQNSLSNSHSNKNEFENEIEETELVQFMGKDNVPFHAIIFPSSLIGCSSTKFKLVDSISATHYLSYGNEKFSKSRGIGIFGEDVISLKEGKLPIKRSKSSECLKQQEKDREKEENLRIEIDIWRFYLMRIRPEKSDTKFCWKDFQRKNNEELKNNVGNLVNRVVGFTQKLLEGKVSLEFDFHLFFEFLFSINNNNNNNKEKEKEKENIFESLKSLLSKKEIEEFSDKYNSYISEMENVALKNSIRICLEFSSLLNSLVENKMPWKVLKENKANGEILISVIWILIFVLINMLKPFLPNICDEIYSYFIFPSSSSKFSEVENSSEEENDKIFWTEKDNKLNGEKWVLKEKFLEEIKCLQNLYRKKCGEENSLVLREGIKPLVRKIYDDEIESLVNHFKGK